MFLCSECHKYDIKAGCPNLHAFRSFGRCESCGDAASCVDCKHYRTFPVKRVYKKPIDGGRAADDVRAAERGEPAVLVIPHELTLSKPPLR